MNMKGLMYVHGTLICQDVRIIIPYRVNVTVHTQYNIILHNIIGAKLIKLIKWDNTVHTGKIRFNMYSVICMV